MLTHHVNGDVYGAAIITVRSPRTGKVIKGIGEAKKQPPPSQGGAAFSIPKEDVGQHGDLRQVVGTPPQSSHQKPHLRKEPTSPAADKSAQPAEPPHTKHKKQYTSRRTYPAYQTYQAARPAAQSRGRYGSIASYGSFGPPAYSSSGP